MNTQIKKMLTKLSIAAGILLGTVATANGQISLSFEASDNSIQVGESFSVDVLLDFPEDYELDWYAFDVNPLSPLSFVSFEGVDYSKVLGAPYDFPDYDIDAFADLGVMGTETRTLATLNFLALGVGSESVNLLGDRSDDYSIRNDGGLSLYDENFNDVFRAFDDNFQVSVSAVPEPSTYAMIGIAVLALGFIKRKRRKPLSA